MRLTLLKYLMDIQELIAHGNHYRSISQPENAIACYAQAFMQDPEFGSAYNNYGNVLRDPLDF